jgi:adenosylcobinamide-GDP ribazoletransferase
VAQWSTAGTPQRCPVAGLVAIAVLALGTRAFHLDGLADTVDGLGSGWDAERALAIMRRGDVGPMGVIAMIVVIGLQGLGYGALADDLTGAITVAMIICLSRTALVITCARPVPAARPEGLGASVAGSVPVPATVVIAVVGVALLVLVGGPAGAVAGPSAYAAVMLLVAHATKRFNGVTGDVLGAAVELAATVLAVAMLINIG